MATLAELRQRQELLPSELKRFGNRVKIFTPARRKGEEWGDALIRTQAEVQEHINTTHGQVYTGHHSESDWSRVYFWNKGWHLFNRTGDYAVITE